MLFELGLSNFDTVCYNRQFKMVSQLQCQNAFAAQLHCNMFNGILTVVL